MSSTISVNHFFTALLTDFEWHVHKSGSYGGTVDFPSPLLMKDILPMFTDRWAAGPDQNMRDFYRRLEPALQLTTLLLSEDYPLLWFSHLTFGKRRRNSSGTYIVPTPYFLSPEAISKVKANLRELGEVITFMFCPDSWGESAWGVTYHNNSNSDRFRGLRAEDWPPILSRRGNAHPVIAMNAQFQQFFSNHYPRSSSTERYRALLTFAVTLGHEVAHAYEFFLGGTGDEPLWSSYEKHAELGFSWETNVIGRVLNPMSGPQDNDGCFGYLCSMHLEERATEADRQRLLREWVGRANAQFTTRDVAGKQRDWPILNPREFRGAKWFLSPNATAIMASVHTIPLQWIVDWFQEDVMADRKMEWARRRMYNPPPLENAFTIIYEKNAHGAQILRPLNPFFNVDAAILRMRTEAQVDAARAAVKTTTLMV